MKTSPSPAASGAMLIDLASIHASNLRWLGALFVGFVCLYGAVQNIGYFDASDSMMRFRMMQALVTTGSLNWTDPVSGEEQICLNSVGPAIAALPFQGAAYGAHISGLWDGELEQILIRATLIGTVVYTALWMCVLAKLCLMLGAGRRLALGICGVAGVCTLVFPYTKSAQAENLVGLGVTAIMVLLLRYDASPRLWMAGAAGLIYGFLLTCKNELAAVFPVLMGAVLIAGDGRWVSRVRDNWRAAAALCLALLPGIAVTLWFNYARFGNALQTGHLGDSHGKSLLTPFTHPFWRGIYLQTFSPGKGVMWYCPVLLAALPLAWHFLKRKPRMLLVGYAWWLVMSCVYAKWYSPAGDTALGARFQVSYLGFGVLPLLALAGRRGGGWAIYRGWTMVCVVVSFALQVLFCAVSFNIDFHRKAYSVESIPEKLALLHKMYYSLEESLLFGFFDTAREKLLDLHFVRWEPLEGALTVLPGFWWLLCGSAVAFGAALWMTETARRFRAVGFSPVILLFIVAVVRAGYPGDEGLRLRVSNAAGARHKTIVQNINITNMDDGRVLYAVPAPAEMRWRGEIFCEQAGRYEFQFDGDRRMMIRLAEDERFVEPPGGIVAFEMVQAGWVDIEIRCIDVQMTDRFVILGRAPGMGDFADLREFRLRH